MTDNWIITIIFAAGVVPFTLLGGWGEYGDYSIWPWSVGFANSGYRRARLHRAEAWVVEFKPNHGA